MKLALIPARGGSKRIPRKNIRPFNGKPMIAWSIEAARDTACFDVIAVSTDDAEIADVARSFGATVPFVRPPELSDDHAGTTAVVRHAVEWYMQKGDAPEVVCCIYATAPFVDPADIRRGLAMLTEEDCSYVFTVTTFPSPIQRAFRLIGGRVEMFQPDQFEKRSQDLEIAYHDAAQFYWGRATAWQAEERLFGSGARAIVLSRSRVQDIDTPEDWDMAELMWHALREQKSLRVG